MRSTEGSLGLIAICLVAQFIDCNIAAKKAVHCHVVICKSCFNIFSFAVSSRTSFCQSPTKLFFTLVAVVVFPLFFFLCFVFCFALFWAFLFAFYVVHLISFFSSCLIWMVKVAPPGLYIDNMYGYAGLFLCRNSLAACFFGNGLRCFFLITPINISSLVIVVRKFWYDITSIIKKYHLIMLICFHGIRWFN